MDRQGTLCKLGSDLLPSPVLEFYRKHRNQSPDTTEDLICGKYWEVLTGCMDSIQKERHALLMYPILKKKDLGEY